MEAYYRRIKEVHDLERDRARGRPKQVRRRARGGRAAATDRPAGGGPAQPPEYVRKVREWSTAGMDPATGYLERSLCFCAAQCFLQARQDGKAALALLEREAAAAEAEAPAAGAASFAPRRAAALVRVGESYMCACRDGHEDQVRRARYTRPRVPPFPITDVRRRRPRPAARRGAGLAEGGQIFCPGLRPAAGGPGRCEPAGGGRPPAEPGRDERGAGGALRAERDGAGARRRGRRRPLLPRRRRARRAGAPGPPQRPGPGAAPRGAGRRAPGWAPASPPRPPPPPAEPRR